MEKQKKLDLEIAIIGGGFAGVYCGKRLRKLMSKSSRTKVGLISDENYMVFQPMLPEVASASISPRHVVNPIRHLCEGIEVYKSEVEQIDVENKKLTLRPGPFSPNFEIRFKHLVVAMGAKVDLSRVPGMSEHAYLMQNVGDAMKLRAAVLARFEEANLVTDADRRKRLLSFVVVGGGYSGVETA
ncbi:MAG TPA: FAD-dependent oxidoreductase, partial [Opitutales bacterium]|nr:FAD-dependent oxidoreductase [Opitutales bacterium]